MNKKKFTVLALLLIVVLTLTSCLLVACNPANSDDDGADKTIKATEGLLINNGDFKVVDTSVSTYPRSATNWTGAKQYSSDTYRDDVTAGVISLEEALYNENKSKWGDDDGEIRNKLLAGGRYGETDKIKNALMIYMPEQGKNADGKDIHGPTAYGYTSSSFSLQKSSYYKLTVDVLTYKIAGKDGDVPGARIYVSSNTFAEFAGINTNGEWKTYEIYIETSPASSTSLTLMLGLGKRLSYYENGLTTGYAFFDNVELTKIEDDKQTDDIEGKVAFDNAYDAQLNHGGVLDGKTVTTATLKVPNGHFDFGSTSLSTSGSPSSWSFVTGNSGKDDPAPTSPVYNGIVDLSKFAENYSKLAKTFQTREPDSATNSTYAPADSLGAITDSIKGYSKRIGSNVFMLSSQLMTAQGIKSSRAITIEKNRTYALSVDIYTYAVHGAGVSLILSGSDGKDIVIKGISADKTPDVLIGTKIIDTANGGYTTSENTGSTTGKWQTYTFYIKGNQYRDYNYNMTIWLGTEGTKSNNSVKYHSFDSGSSTSDTSVLNATGYDGNGTFSNGWAFIDELVLTQIAALPDLNADSSIAGANDEQTLDCTDSDKVALIVDLTTANSLGDIFERGTGNSVADYLGADGKLGLGAPVGWKSEFDIEDMTTPVVSGIISEGIVNLSSEDVFNGKGAYPKLPYDTVSKNAYSIHASSDSSYEVESDDIVIEANKFYRLSLWVKTQDVNSASGAYVYLINRDDEDETLTSFTKINTFEYDEYYNDWCELTVVIRGAEDKNTNVALRFSLGTGNRWATTLTDGAMYVANVNMTTITYANFNDTSTGTYTKTVNLSKSYTYTVTNGSFDGYDLDDENLTSGEALKNQSVAATPENWTINDNTIDINGKNGSNLYAGVIALDKVGNSFATSAQAQAVTGLSADVFNSFYNNIGNEYGDDYLNSLAGPYMLALGSTDAQKSYAAGFASDNISLSANTYYSLSVYVKTFGNTKASVFLTGESSVSDGQKYFAITNAVDKDWTKYTFYIEVGNTSVSVKLNLWLGYDAEYMNVEEDEALSSGKVFFDNVVLASIGEDVYNDANADVEENVKLSFTTDSFDSLSSSAESRQELVKPENWTGAADTNQTSSNTKGGIIYADSQFYETEVVNGVSYARILGAEYKLEDITVTDQELTDAKENNLFPELTTDSEILEALKQKKLDDKKTENWIPVNELYAKSGNRMLIINNTTESGYIYTGTSNTLAEDSFYKVSVWVRTYGLKGKDGGANVELYLGSANETNNALIFKGINTQKPATDTEPASNEWTKYEFYVKTLEEKVTSVTLKLSLGRYTTTEENGESVVKGLMSGYAMFDDVSIEKVEERDYEQAVASDSENILTRQVAADTSGKKDEEGNNQTPAANKFNLDYLWWMIPTIVIGLVIIVVVIVLVIRKVKPTAKRVSKKVNGAPMSTEMLDKKRSRYDEGKE